MKRVSREQRDDRGDEATDLGERASGVSPAEPRSSGVWERTERTDSGGAASQAATYPGAGPCRRFEDVYTNYKHCVWARICRSGAAPTDARDLFQKTFTALHRWTRAHGVPESPGGLVLTIAEHQIASHHRERQRREQRIDGEVEVDTQPSSKPDPEQLYGRAEAKEKVEVILARMPTNAALVFRLVEIDMLPQEDVAQLLGLSAGTLRVQLHRARARFWDLAARLYDVRCGDPT